ncbi:MAG: hypothetical protein HY581_02590 [Nitrospirae bacterium]|nr:hypothetical protein [Nitrospirota bacterium]
MRTRWIVLILASVWVMFSAAGAFAQDVVMHSGNVTKIDKDSGAIEIMNANGKPEKFTVTDKDILASPVWKRRLNVGDGADIKTSGDKVVTVLRRNLPVTIRPAEPGAAKK